MAGKLFRASSHQQALQSIRSEYGDDAVILSTKHIPATAPGLVDTIEILAVSPSALKERQRKRSFGSIQRQHTLSPTVGKFSKLLALSGLNQNLIRRLLYAYKEPLTNSQQIDLSFFREALQQNFQFGIRHSPRRRLAVVGPTGVGKTTTIAKIAGQALWTGRSDIALITTDTHRVGGSEQLQHFASLYGIPFRTASDFRELREQLHVFSEQSLVLIDTAGCGPRDLTRLAEQKLMLSEHDNLDIMLLLPASGNSLDMSQSGKAFSDLQPLAVGVTKTDETSYFGPCLNVLYELMLPIAVFGTGQNVPEDLVQANAERVSELLLQKVN
jgi:flagellar biosynthesis protein FlhF